MHSREELERWYILTPQDYNPGTGYPGHLGMFYQCPECASFFPARPTDYSDASCLCGNVGIDIEMGRLYVRCQQPLLFSAIVR